MYGYTYKTTNLITGKIYIGKHKSEEFDPTYKGSGTHLWNSIRKYGWDNFLVEMLSPCFSEDELNAEEELLIDLFNSRDRSIGYNIAKGGAGGSGPCSDETKAKISKSLREGGKLAGSNNPMYGVSRTGQDSPHYGCKHSQETRELLSKLSTGRPSPMKGKHLSEAARANIKAARQYTSDESRKKMSDAKRGHSNWTDAGRQQMSQRLIGNTYASACKGQKRSDEAKARYSAVAKNRRWIHKDGVIKAVQSEELDAYLADGWKRGRK